MKNKRSAVLTAITVFVIAAVLLFAFYLPGGKTPQAPAQEALKAAETLPHETHENKDKAEEAAKPDEAEDKAPEKPEKPEKEEETRETPEKAEELPEEEPTPAPADTPTDTGEDEKEAETDELTCTISIRCDTLLANINSLNKEKRGLVPENGVIFPETAVIFYEGESVFNVLKREMKKNKIHMEFVNTPVYGSVYIEGIANLYEFDCGELSGWMYKVNGVFPNYGCSKYILKKGDRIEWVYTCDLGADVGGDYKRQVSDDE